MIDLLAFVRITKLSYVKKVLEEGDISSFYFKPARPLKHTAGQHGVFFLPRFKGVHIFSLASAPDEEFVMISTHVRKESRFKQALDSLKPGDKLTLLGPIFNFILPKSSAPVVFLAQGIGITPFRSMLMHKYIHGLDVPITLVHVDSHPHTYKSFTETAATSSHYPTTPEDFTEIVTRLVADSPQTTMFYMSGSPRYCKATKETLRSLGVTGRRIKKDGFLGY